MTTDWGGERYDEWQQRVDRPLLVLSVLLVPLLVVRELDRHLSRAVADSLDAADYLIWAVFVVDYLTRLRLASQRRAFVRHNVPDLVLVLIPFLRPLRAARALRILRLGRVAASLRLIERRGAASLQRRVLTYVGSVAAASTLLAAVSMDDVERDAVNANIHGFGDSLWWALTTISTVGYGDRYPVTTAGRVIAFGLIIVGVTLFGTLTASLATYFVRHVQESSTDVTENEMAARLERIEQLLAQLAGPSSTP